MKAPLLADIEKSFMSSKESPVPLLDQVPTKLLFDWEKQSSILREGLHHIQYWETRVSTSFPISYERLKKSANRRNNAISALGDPLWRNQLQLILDEDKKIKNLWKQKVPIQLADEYGINDTTIPANLETSEAFDKEPMKAIRVWKPLVLFENSTNGYLELIWIRDEEYSFWALNRNTLKESPEDFLQPPFLKGDETLRTIPLVCAIESPRMTLAVILRQREILLFDHFKQDEKKTVRHWRHVLTDELWEPRAIPIVAYCFILDAYLLYASADGILRAKPRNNPHSTYHVRDVKSLVIHMISLYNVLAIVYSHNILEVWHIARIKDDPYIRFESLFRHIGVDSRHAPLLYGPYVIYQSFEGTWYKHNYEQQGSRSTLVKMPFQMTVVNIQNANWKYWSVILRNAGKEDEFQFSSSPSKIMSCIDCGEKAKYLCGKCLEVGFCEKHKNTHC